MLVYLCVQVIIEATTGSGQAGDIALDDLSFTNGCQMSTGSVVTIPTQLTTPTPQTPCKFYRL